MDFSGNLRYYRLRKGITQKELATALNTNNTTLSNWEKGISKPDIDIIIKISNYFGISIDKLIFSKHQYDTKSKGQIIENSDKKLSSQYTPIQIKPSKTSSFAVPFYDISVSAGPLGVLTYSAGAVEPDGYIDMEISRRCDAILPVIGVSMEPEIHSGDLVGIRELD